MDSGRDKLHVVLACGVVAMGALGCKLFKGDDTAASDGGSSATPAASSSSAAAAPACKVETPFSIDKAARADTGLTLVKLSDGTVAVGYATGNGTPKAAVIDDTGKSSVVEVDAKHIDVERKAQDAQRKAAFQDAKTNRTVMRVTPLGMKGLKMRVGVDLLDLASVGESGVHERYLRCGPADGDPIVTDEGPSFYDSEWNPAPVDMTQDSATETRDCRTFSNGTETWVLASTMSPNNGTGNFEAGWVIDEKPGKEHVQDPSIDSTVVTAPKDKSAPKPVLYEVPVSLRIPGGDFITASRLQGKLIVAKRKADLEPDGDAVKLAFAGPIGMASLAVLGSNVALLVPSTGKTEVLGATWPASSAAVKPTAITFDDPNAPTDGDRTSVSTAATGDGDLLVGFVDGKAQTHKARLTLLTSDLKSKKPVFDITDGTANVSELRVSVLKDGRYFVTYLKIDGGVGEVMGAIASCK
jgi:hypothetical protein